MSPEVKEPSTPGRLGEISGQFTDIVAITELRGSYPNVPVWPGVDYAALVADDPEPVFLTIPIGKANVKSGNGRYYDDAWLQEFHRQVMELKPVGIMGHLSKTQRETEFPPEAVHWVGAVIEQGTLWGKGYIPPGEARSRIRRYKAQGRALATSFDGFAEGKWDESLQAFRMDAKTLRLGQIDIAPADRAGIADLARLPALTSEMTEPSIDTVIGETKEPIMAEKSKLEYIQELTEADARLLPDPVRAAVLATVQPPPEVATVATIRETLGLDAKTDVAAHIAEMKRTQAEQAKAAVTNRIKELVKDGIKLEDVRPLVTELVTARNPQTVEAAEVAYKEVAALPSVTALLQARVVETMGPNQRTPVAGQGKPRYFDIPKAA